VALRRIGVLALAFVIPPVGTGAITIAVRLHGEGGTLDAAPVGDLDMPGPRRPTTRQPLAVILVGNHGTEITDSLPIVELLAASGAFEVRTVAPERRPSPFATRGDGGAAALPDRLGISARDGVGVVAPETPCPGVSSPGQLLAV
jgi:hypothetical protein